MLLHEPPHRSVNRNDPFELAEGDAKRPELDPANNLQLRLLQYRLALANPTRS